MESKAPTHYTFYCQKNNYSKKVLISENSTFVEFVVLRIKYLCCVISHLDPCNSKAQAQSCVNALRPFFLPFALYDVIQGRFPKFGHLRHTLLNMKTEAPPMYYSNLLLVRGSQSEESFLEGRVVLK